MYAIGTSFAIGLVYLLSLTLCIQVGHASLQMTTSFSDIHSAYMHAINSADLSLSYDASVPTTLSTTLSHLIVNFSIQDLSDLTDPTISLSGSYVAQIMWDVFESRYGYGLPSLLLMLLPLGAIFFCGMFSITSASRCPLKMIVMDCQSKHMCINMRMSFRCSNVTSFCVLSFENVLWYCARP